MNQKIVGNIADRDKPLPTTRSEISRALSRLKIAKLLHGYRGQAPTDIDAAMAVVEYTHVDHDRIIEMDINPLFALPKGKVLVAGDALIRLKRVAPE